MMIRHLLFCSAMLCIGLPSAMAADAHPLPTLKAQVSVVGEVVRIGDLVEHAGAAEGVAVFRAPDLGQTGLVATARVLEALRAHDLSDVDTRGLAGVEVTRASRTIGLEEIQARIVEVLARQHRFGNAGDLVFGFDRPAPALQLDPGAGEPAIVRAGFDPTSHRFDVSFEVAGSGRPRYVRYTGTLNESVEATLLTRSLARGDIIKASDIVVERLPKGSSAAALAKTGAVVGMAARNALQANQPLRTADLMRPEMVHANESVTMFFEAPGLLLTVRGKALESGTEGDVVNVLNVQSKRTVQGTVIGPGRVSIVSTTPVMVSANTHPPAAESKLSLAANAP